MKTNAKDERSDAAPGPGVAWPCLAVSPGLRPLHSSSSHLHSGPCRFLSVLSASHASCSHVLGGPLLKTPTLSVYLNSFKSLCKIFLGGTFTGLPDWAKSSHSKASEHCGSLLTPVAIFHLFMGSVNISLSLWIM